MTLIDSERLIAQINNLKLATRALNISPHYDTGQIEALDKVLREIERQIEWDDKHPDYDWRRYSELERQHHLKVIKERGSRVEAPVKKWWQW